MDKFTVIVELLFMVLLSGCILIGRNDYFIKSGKVWYKKYYIDSKQTHYVVASDEVQEKIDLIKALNLIEKELL